MPERISKKPPIEVREWIEYLKRSLRARRIYRISASEDSITKFAARLMILGSPTNETATKVFGGLVQLVFSYQRVMTLSANVDHLPVDPAQLQRVAAAVGAAAVLEPVESAKFQVVKFIEVAVKLSDPRAYVEVCCRDGLRLIRAVFHPNTWKVASQRYRGVVGDLASPEYIAEVRTKLKTVS